VSKTQAVLLNELSQRLGDPHLTYFSAEELRTWINEGASGEEDCGDELRL
jgi:hypothetical protein